MDKSNAPQYTDQQIRVTALNFALQVVGLPAGYPEDFMQITRSTYLFLAGNDPLVDLGAEVTIEGDTAEVISFEDAVQMLLAKGSPEPVETHTP